jgi:hypothetical protein
VATSLPEWNVGDAVKRPVNVLKRSSPYRRGVVTEAYNRSHRDETMYAVHWHTEAGKPIDMDQRGFFGFGLEPDDKA